MTVLGALSDTLRLLQPSAAATLQGSDALRAIAPVTAVRGNVDVKRASSLPDRAKLMIGGQRLLMLRDLKTLTSDPRAEGYSVVVSGYSHRPGVARHGAVLYVNPGSAGPGRFRLPIAVARIELSTGSVEARIVDLEDA